MTFFDFAHLHPWWTLVYLLMLDSVVIACARAYVLRGAK
jgi:hypothetical protein